MSIKVEGHHLTVQFKEHEALTNVSFTLESGKIYGLIGRNGAGKTSLLSLLASYRKPSSGTLKINGEDIFENEKWMAEVTFVHQTNYKDEYDTAEAYLKLAERYRPSFDRKYAEEVAALFKLPLNQPVRKLSTGMQSALNATIGLATRSKVTIFDEAYQGMDAPTREVFYKEILEDQARFPRVIILSTHLVSEMEYLFDEVLMIHKGKLMIQEPIDTLLQKGFSVTGDAEQVEQFAEGLETLSEQRLGGTKSVMVYGAIPEDKIDFVRQSGLEVGNVTLHDLFIQLTNEKEEN
ncbi:ABC transporter ATP-binding protein YtrB [Halalkalibacter krulwichiae]|uniref:ABC transporter ATP-binding protein YtrB n=2 Tax=Halalkalibacter krulwichiae TaxID=199441 RepID=A0A1X9M902_9BACI|nr:ABC transporter ATP-binding protein [Halalkalibacter krulwichiae]ARK29867.1 ABC transporter ATP-binding protein YtrB [Halalkalibacter krulwichiae]